MDGRIFHIQEKLSRDLRESWTVARMAAEVGVTPGHFIKVFKLAAGVSPLAYLLELRLERARYLLETTFHPVKQIARETGFQSDSRMTHEFKRKFGASPTEYRRQRWESVQCGQRPE